MSKPLQAKFTLILFLISVLPLALMSVNLFQEAHRKISDSIKTNLTTVRALKGQQIHQYLQRQTRDIQTLASSPATVTAYNELAQGYLTAKDVRAQYLANPDGEGIRQENSFDFYHQDHHGYFKHYVQSYDYYNVLLIDNTGEVIYTVLKEDDFARNLLTGPYKDSVLAESFRRLQAEPEANNGLVFSEYSTYLPSNRDISSFLLTPIRSEGRIIGTLAFQVPISTIDKLMRSGTGLGETGESYLVGQDRLMRSSSRFVENSILNTEVRSESVQAALAGETGHKLINNYRDERVISAYEPIITQGRHWALITEVSELEAYQTKNHFIQLVLVIAALSVISATWFGYAIFKNDLGKDTDPEA